MQLVVSRERRSPSVFFLNRLQVLSPVSFMSHSPKPPSLAPSRKSIFREEFNSDHTLSHLNLGLPAAEDAINSGTNANMAASPTPRELRRLASDHNFVLGATDPGPRRLGLLSFLGSYLYLTAALIAGIISVVVAIAYTVVTSKQLLECPSWVNECRSLDLWTAENLGVIQGIITTVYLIGLSALAYISLSLCEAALWPLVHTQPLTIRGLEGFLALTHGNIMSLPHAARSIRSVSAAFIFIICLLSILLPLAAPPLVGYAYTPTSEAVTISSNISSLLSPVLDRPFTQTNPPSAFVPALTTYTTYTNNPSSEPLPDFRNWLMDRATLSTRGSFTAKAVHLETNIACHGQPLQQLQKNGLWWNAFKTTTNLSSTRHTPSGEIWFRPQPHLTVFLDDVRFPSSNSINTTIIFAALNGTISGGETTPLSLGDITTASAVSCEIITTASDATLTVGPHHPPESTADNTNLPVLSTLSHFPNLTSTLTWLTASPLLVGISIQGSQPLFSNHSTTHLPTSDLTGSNNWTIPGIKNFISVSIGAFATSLFSISTTSSPQQQQQQEMISLLDTRKLSTERAYLLLILPLLYVLFIVFMALWNAITHKKYQIPVMRTMGISEVVKSSQTGWLREKAGVDAAKSYLPSELGGLGVRFGVVGGGEVGFGPADQGEDGVGVSGFVAAKEKKGKGREPEQLGNDGSGSRVGSRVHTGNSSVSWRESYHGGGREPGERERGYQMERGEWPRNGDL